MIVFILKEIFFFFICTSVYICQEGDSGTTSRWEDNRFSFWAGAVSKQAGAGDRQANRRAGRGRLLPKTASKNSGSKTGNGQWQVWVKQRPLLMGLSQPNYCERLPGTSQKWQKKQGQEDDQIRSWWSPGTTCVTWGDHGHLWSQDGDKNTTVRILTISLCFPCTQLVVPMCFTFISSWTWWKKRLKPLV